MKNRLEQYGMLVAGAAGVAVAGAASADVVVNGGNITPPESVSGGTIALDLDNDGTTDINITHNVAGGFGGGDMVQATGGNIAGIAFSASGGQFPNGFYASQFASATAALNAGASLFGSNYGYMRDGNGYGNSGWTGSDTGFLAVQFTSGAFGLVNGYVEISVDPDNTNGTLGQSINTPTILSYGFENNVPEPGSLGLLALGAVGLLSRRKKSA